MKKLSHSFSARLSFYILMITAFLFVVAITIVALSSHRLIKDEATKNAGNMVRATNLQVEKILTAVETAVINQEWLVANLLDNQEYLYIITKKMIEDNDNIVGCAIAFEPYYFPGKQYYAPFSYLDSDGNVKSKQLGNSSYDYHTMEWYQIPKLTAKPYWSEPYYDEGGGEKTITTYSLPLLDANGHVYAVMTADLSMDGLCDYVASIKPYENSYTVMIGRSATYIVHNQKERVLNETVFKVALETNDQELFEIAKDMLKGESGVKEFRNNDNMSFVVYAPISNGWATAIICPYKDVFRRMMEMNLILLYVSTFGLFLLFLLCLVTIRRITKPLSEFAESAISIADGHFDTTLPEIHSKDEMRRLYDSFEYMQHSLVNYIAELKQTTAAKQHIESELSIARDIQMSMLPKNTVVNPQIDAYAILYPAKEVGGDLYDYFCKDGKFYFAIGDVSGKGVPASLYMAITRSAFRYIAALGFSPDRILSKLNNTISEGNETNMFITMFVGVVDLATGKCTYCNGGHNPQILISPSGEASYMKVLPNLAVGLMPGFEYKQQEMTMEAGSRILMYTDGISEAENETQELFGEERLLAALNTLSHHESKAIVEEVYRKVKDFTGHAAQNDDITILTFNIIK